MTEEKKAERLELEGLCYHDDAVVTTRPSYYKTDGDPFYAVRCPECGMTNEFNRTREEAEERLAKAPPQTKLLHPEEVFEMLEKRGISKVELEYDGGNDSGGVQSITVTGNSGEKLDASLVEPEGYPWYQDPTRVVIDGHGQREPDTRPLTQEDVDKMRLSAALEQPERDRYGSWAGDFHAYGTITWDVASRTAEMDDHYGETTYEDSSFEIYS